MAAKLAALLRRKRTEAELSREVAAHLTLLEDDFRSQGMSEEDARLAARRSYGNVELTKELHRDEWRFAWFDALWQDLRAAWRSLRKSPGFVAVAVVSLAFGIGANTAIFTMVNGVLLKKLPVADPERIVQVEARREPASGSESDVSASFRFPVFGEIAARTEMFDDVIGYWPRPAVLELEDRDLPIALDLVAGSFFQFLEARPVLGRLLSEEDNLLEGAPSICVISFRVWQQHFGGDTGVIDRMIGVNGTMLRVVGVAPDDLAGPELQRRTDVWAPAAVYSSMMRGDGWLYILARLPAGTSIRAADERLGALSASIESATPGPSGRIYGVRDGSKGFDTWRSDLRSPLWILLGAVGLVLLAACANLANLLLARMNDRSQEFAVKLSLGVGRRRLLRQVLAETLFVAIAGGAVALALSAGLTRFVVALFNEGRRAQDLAIEPDGAVFGYAFGVCLLTVLLAGFYPAWRASRTDHQLGSRMVSSSRARRSLVRRTLILVQVGVATVLLFSCILFASSLRNLRTVELGYETARILTVETTPRNLQDETDPTATALVFDELTARVRGLPGVEAAAAVFPAVLTGDMSMGNFSSTRDDGTPAPDHSVHIFLAGTEYFSTLTMPILQGRDFGDFDNRNSPPVAIVNRKLAAQSWPGENPIGKRVVVGSDAAEVIGVVGDTRYRDVREAQQAIAYRPFAQANQGFGSLQVRLRDSRIGAEPEIRQLIASAAPGYRVVSMSSIEQLRDRVLAQDRLLTFLSTLFGALGVGLALVGIYGLISYSVAQRTHEIGVRVSVGAQRSQIVRLVLSEATALVVLGIAVGVPLALALSRWLESLLFEVTPSDPLHVAATLVVLVLGGAVAAYLPALRATRIHPLEALKCD